MALAGGLPTSPKCPIALAGGLTTSPKCPMALAGGLTTSPKYPIALAGGLTTSPKCPIVLAGGLTTSPKSPMVLAGGLPVFFGADKRGFSSGSLSQSLPETGAQKNPGTGLAPVHRWSEAPSPDGDEVWGKRRDRLKAAYSSSPRRRLSVRRRLACRPPVRL